MNWRRLIPGYGDKTVRNRIWELEKKAGSLPTLFAVLLGAYIVDEAKNFPIEYLSPRYRVLIAAITVAVLFIYRDKRERAVKRARDKAKEISTPAGQQKISDYDQ